MTTLIAASPSLYWYVTRGSGVVTLLLLTASICLGILTTVRWRTDRFPRFVVAGLHRNVTLLAVAFLVVHVVTTIADGFAPIGVRDAIVPFLSGYRTVWLGLGTLACDLLLAVVISSVLRARVGFRAWRAVHWLAYASWPLALLHSLGTGSDARFGWMATIAVVCISAVSASVLVRVARGNAEGRLRLVAGAAAIAVPLGVLAWYESGPAQRGWAARAGTPSSILHAHAPPVRVAVVTRRAGLPASFDGSVSGRLTQEGPDRNGFVTVRLDTDVLGRIHAKLRLALKGVPVAGGGVSMRASGVAFAAAGSPVFEGSVVALSGNQIAARVSAGSAGTFDLVLRLRLNPSTGLVTGALHGSRSDGVTP